MKLLLFFFGDHETKKSTHRETGGVDYMSIIIKKKKKVLGFERESS